MRLWRYVLVVVIFAGLLTSCGRPLVTNRRTPTARNSTASAGIVLTASAAAGTPSIDVTPSATAQVAEAAPTDQGGTAVADAESSTGGTEIAPTTGSAQEAATVLPSEVIAPTSTTIVPTVPISPEIVIVPATRVPVSNNERWREQEVNRQPLPKPQTYVTTGTSLYWYDPQYQQSVLLGTFNGPFEVLATFELRGTGQPALEVLYEVNKRYGLTALSPAIVERIRAAGYTDGVIDTYVILDSTITPR